MDGFKKVISWFPCDPANGDRAGGLSQDGSVAPQAASAEKAEHAGGSVDPMIQNILNKFLGY